MAWTVEDFLKRLRTTGFIEQAPGSGRPRMRGVVCRPVSSLKAGGHFEH